MTRARDLSRAVNNKMSVFKYTATAGQTTFTGADGGGATLAYDPNSMIVTYNGIILESTSEYTATNGTSIVLTAGAEVGAEVNILAFEDVAYSGVMPTTGGTFTGAVTHNSTVTHTGDVTITGAANDADGNLKVTTNAPTNYPAMVVQTSTGGNTTETHGLHIKNTAAGHGLRIDDESSDTTPFVVASDGKVGLGTTAPVHDLQIHKATASSQARIQMTTNESGSTNADGYAVAMEAANRVYHWLYENAPMQFATNNTLNMEIKSSGAVTKPNQPSFMIRGSSGNKSIASGAAVASGMYNPTVLHNVGNHLNTSNAVFTAPFDGRYYMEWIAYTQTSGGLKNEYVATYLNFSNCGPIYGFHECGPDVCAQISGIFNMSANDTVQPYTYGHGSRTQHYIGQHSYFSGHLLG